MTTSGRIQVGIGEGGFCADKSDSETLAVRGGSRCWWPQEAGGDALLGFEPVLVDLQHTDF